MCVSGERSRKNSALCDRSHIILFAPVRLSSTSAKSAGNAELSVQELWYELTRTDCPLSVPQCATYHFWYY